MSLKVVLNALTGEFDLVNSSTGIDAFVPTLIASGATFTIPANKQAVAALPIVIDGTLIIDGSLVML